MARSAAVVHDDGPRSPRALPEKPPNRLTRESKNMTTTAAGDQSRGALGTTRVPENRAGAAGETRQGRKAMTGDQGTAPLTEDDDGENLPTVRRRADRHLARRATPHPGTAREMRVCTSACRSDPSGASRPRDNCPTTGSAAASSSTRTTSISTWLVAEWTPRGRSKGTGMDEWLAQTPTGAPSPRAGVPPEVPSPDLTTAGPDREQQEEEDLARTEADQLLTAADLARRCHTTEQGVYGARYRCACPPALHIGRRLLWRMDDVEAWESVQLDDYAHSPRHYRRPLRRATIPPSAAETLLELAEARSRACSQACTSTISGHLTRRRCAGRGCLLLAPAGPAGRLRRRLGPHPVLTERGPAWLAANANQADKLNRGTAWEGT